MGEALELAGPVANRNLEHAIYLHRSCRPLAVVDLGGRDVGGGVAYSECGGMCGL